MNIIKMLREDGFRSSIGTSFSVDLPFYEQVVEPRMRGRSCHNNLLLVDARTYCGALPIQAGLFNGAGRRYAVQPVALGGAFHPKVLLQVGERKGRALFGSANLTFRGLCHNQELVTELRCTPSDSPELRLFASLFDWVFRWCDPRARATRLFLRALDAGAPWLRTAPRSTGLEPMPDGREVRWVFSPNDRSVPERFAELLGGDPIRRLIVLAPFWDDELRALQDLTSAVHPRQGVVVVQADTVRFPVAARKRVPFDIAAFERSPNRYLHAKLVIAEGRAHDHVLSGSGNCSVAAFGMSGRPAANCEAMLYQRMPGGTAVTALGLVETLSASPLTDLSEIAVPPSPGDDGKEAPPYPGLFEAHGREVRWLPASGLPVEGAAIDLLDRDSEPLLHLAEGLGRDSGRLFRAERAVPAEACLAKVSLADGRGTAVALIHRIEELRRAVPGPRSGPLLDALEKVRVGDSDFLSLLEPFQKTLFQEAKEEPGKTTGAALDQQPDEPDPDDDRVLPYEEFLAGRKVRSTGHSGTIAAPDGDTSLLVGLLFELFGGRRPPEQRASTEDESTELEDAPDEPPAGPATPPERTPVPEGLTARDVERARERILRLLEAFERWAKELRTNHDARIGPAQIPRYWALVAILGHLAAYRVRIGGKKKMDILPLDAEDGIDFVGTMLRVLGGFFCYRGPNATPPLASRLDVPEASADVPDDYFGAWMACAWAVCAAMEVLSLPAAAGLPATDAQDIETIGWWIYTRTGLSAGAFDDDACVERLRRIHGKSSLGSHIPIRTLIARHRWFLDLVDRVRPPANWRPDPKDRKVGDRFRVGDRVVTKTLGPRYVREVLSDAVVLNNPGPPIPEDEDPERLKVVPGMIARMEG